jgi:hypothetical protein
MTFLFIVLFFALLAVASIAGWGVDSRDSRSNRGPLTRDLAQVPALAQAPADNGRWG